MSWLMFLLLFLLSSSSTCARHTCLEDQRFSLLQFKKTFTITANAFSEYCESDSHPKTVFWNESSDCCSWEGVKCDWSNGHVIGLDLSCSHLQGTIQPNSTLFHLRHLQTLNLAFNDFNLSTISPDFGSFPSLTHLNLSFSNFTGRIPSKISHLSKLISLDLDVMNFNPHGDDSSPVRLEQHTFNMLLRNLTQLRVLHLDWLNISSPLPHALLNLSSLISLGFGGCQLRGKFSEAIFHLPNLRELNFWNNPELTGKLPYFNVTSSFQFLDFSYVSFSGRLPESIGNLKALDRLYLFDCNFSGSIPASIWNLTQITVLNIGLNNFGGQIPSSISNLAKLIDLGLFGNNLNGQIPDSLGNMSQLTFIHLGDNSLIGTIPSSLFALPSLVRLDLGNNKLQGPIP